MYELLFGLGLPGAVNKIFTGSGRYTKDGVVHATMGKIWQTTGKGMSLRALMEVMYLACEFEVDCCADEDGKRIGKKYEAMLMGNNSEQY